MAMAAVVTLVAACGSDASGGSGGDLGSDTQRALYEEAVNAGGRLSVFVGTTATRQLEQLAAAFNEQYPDVSIEYVTGTGDQVSERLLTEKRAGLNNADVLILPGIKSFRAVQDYMERYVPEGAEKFTYDPDAYIEGVAYAYSDYRGGVCYNANKLSPQEVELLKTYEGWVDPVFKGRVALSSPAGFHYRRNMSFWAYEVPELGWSWLERLAALQPVVTDDPNSVLPQVVAGEYDVIYNIGSLNGPRAAAAGTPIKCLVADPTPITLNSIGVVKDAPNPAAAKLFVNWILTDEGQDAVQKTLGYEARRQGEPIPIEGLVPANGEERVADEDLVDEKYSELVANFERIFGAARDKK